MTSQQFSQFCALRAFIVVAAAGLLPVLAAPGGQRSIGEKIQFSDPGDSAELPQSRVDDRALSRRFEFLNRGNSISAVVEPLVMPSPNSLPVLPRNQRLLELFEEKLDQKKNWIYGGYDTLRQTRSLNEMFGVRETGAESRTSGSRKALENFFEERNAKPATNRYSSDWNRRNRERREDASKIDQGRNRDRGFTEGLDLQDPGSFDPNRVVGAGFFFSGDIIPAAGGQLRGLKDLTGLSENLAGRPREQASHADEFRKLLAAPGINPFVIGFDPIRLQVDTPRQELNPVAPKPTADLPAQSPFDTLGGISGSGASSSLGALTDPGAKILGPSSLSPVVRAPQETPAFKPPPAVLEFPTRKF